MAAFAFGLMVLFAMAGHLDASYCVCNTGLSDSVLQKNIDYACGAGADCSAILQTGPCFNPNTVKDHCNYAVNSYYQRRGSAGASCDFQGTATVVQTAPSAASGCVYQSTPGGGGSTTPTAGGTPSNTGGTTTIPGSTSLGPSGNGFGNTDNSAGVTALCSILWTMVVVCTCFWWGGY